MKNENLKIISSNIKKLMEENTHFDTKLQLAEASSITYSSLSPIVNGERDFAVTKLVNLANALNCDPNEILAGTYTQPLKISKSKITPQFYISCISIDQMCYCSITDKNQTYCKTLTLNNGISCRDSSENTIKNIIHQISQEIPSFDSKKTNIFLSIQGYEYTHNRENFEKVGNKYFLKFVIQSDWKTNYDAFLKNNNGICITIGNGVSIVYSNDEGKSLHKIQGLGFPISDDGGNLWLGCKAMRHAINVKQGLEKRSYLSDRILSLFNSDLSTMTEMVATDPNETYISCSKIIKEAAYKKSEAYEIIKDGYNKIIETINLIDNKLKIKLPVILAGENGYLYDEFFDKKRLKKTDTCHIDILQQYGLNSAQNLLN